MIFVPQPPVLGYQNGKILGYYIGYKETQSSGPFIYVTHVIKGEEAAKMSGKREIPSSPLTQYTIRQLKKFTQYSIHVKAYNLKGISPASEDLNVFTLEDGEFCLIRKPFKSLFGTLF